MPQKQVYLVKDSNDLVSWCDCEPALVSYPAQADCPWCGCGWLFTCMSCRKAFAFARAVEIPETLQELGERDVRAFWGEISEEKKEALLADWLDLMTELLADVQVGKRYVYFDGYWLDVDKFPIQLNGWYGRHELNEAPQIAALRDPGVKERMLANYDYWRSHAYSETE